MQEIHLTARDGIGWLVLDRPERHNAITVAMWEGLIALLDQADGDPAIKVVVVRGAGNAAFAAGADLGEIGRLGDAAEAVVPMEIYARAQRRLVKFRKPTIAMIHGHCIGAGCGVATACDFRLADQKARFSVPAARMGQVYRLEETRRLAQLIGIPLAKRMLFTGCRINAEEARNAGLVEEVVPEADLEARVTALAAEIGAVSQFTAQSMKRIFAAIAHGQTEDDDVTRQMFLDALDGPDFHEGMAAAKEKRSPDFPFR